MNLKIREFELSLKKYINEVDLPVEVKRITLLEIYNEMEKMAEESIKKEIEERKENE